MPGILNLILGGVGVVKDAYFNLVSLLLPGNGTNGAQNNTFLDSSTNNFTITRNGNTTQGTFSPFSQTGWGNYLPTTSERLTTASSSSDFSFGTGDFTIEGFVNLSAASSCMVFQMSTASTGYNASSSNSVCLYVGASGNAGKLEIYANNTNYASTNVMISSSDIGKWYHFAIVRSSGSTTVYWNGSAVAGLTSISDSANYTMTYCVIGTIYNNTYSLQGYLSNFRVLKGTAQYSGASITVPTSPFATGTTNQVLLICQSNRFIDSNTATTAKTITVTGSPSVVAFSPFAPTAAYTTAAVGGSGYFDGTNDNLVLPSSSNLAVGTGDFCVEAWVYWTTTGVLDVIYSNTLNSGGGDTQLSIQLTTGNKVQVAGWSTVFLTGATSVVSNTWNHIAVCRSGTTLSIFLNGSRDATATSSNNWSSTNAFYIGDYPVGGGAFSGYISNLRVVKGSTPYDATLSSITVPTAPLTAITNTQLLLNYTNAGITDATAKNDLETVGNAQINTSVSKFGGGSIAFNASANTYLSQNPATTDLYAFGSGDFTIEGWLYLNSTTGIQTFYDGRPNGSSNAAVPTIYITSGSIRYYVSAVDRITGSTLSTGQWYHIAIARSGGSTRMFINGTQAGSTYTDSTVYLNSANRPFIGGDSNTPGSNLLNGYIDDFRITKGYARYTGNFTPPTAPFPKQ